jgi:hypothetical protein
VLRVSCVALLVTVLSAHYAGAQSPPKQPPYPKGGIDYSGIDEFYRVAAVLTKDIEPTAAQWRALMATPGYRLVEIDNEGIRDRIDLALKPSRRAERDSVIKANGDKARALRHLIRAAGDRAAIMKTRAILERSMNDSIAMAAQRTARFLPKGTIERFPTPFIGFAIFLDDGYAEDPGVLLDPLYVQDNGVVALLSHEFHHSYTGLVDHLVKRADIEAMATPPADVRLFLAVMFLRNEGIADQVDKTYPLPANPKADWYAPVYNAAYAKTPAFIHSLDSLLALAADRPAQTAPAGEKANAMLKLGGHPNGAYVAREIVETFGIDSLMPGVYSPIAFLRTYASAEARRGNPPPFSAKAWSELAALEKHYVTR